MAGSPAKKVGNRYEEKRTTYVLPDLLTGRIESVRLEAPGETGFGFYTSGGGARRFHQVKRQTAASGQRKGRIQRIGQARDKIYVCNMRYKGSVEDPMHQRLFERTRQIRDIFGQLPDTLEAVWVDVAR